MRGDSPPFTQAKCKEQRFTLRTGNRKGIPQLELSCLGQGWAGTKLQERNRETESLELEQVQGNPDLWTTSPISVQEQELNP